MNLKETLTPLPILSEDEGKLDPSCFRPDDEVITADDLYAVRLSTLKNIQIIYDRKTSIS